MPCILTKANAAFSGNGLGIRAFTKRLWVQINPIIWSFRLWIIGAAQRLYNLIFPFSFKAGYLGPPIKQQHVREEVNIFNHCLHVFSESVKNKYVSTFACFKQ